MASSPSGARRRPFVRYLAALIVLASAVALGYCTRAEYVSEEAESAFRAPSLVELLIPDNYYLGRHVSVVGYCAAAQDSSEAALYLGPSDRDIGLTRNALMLRDVPASDRGHCVGPVLAEGVVVPRAYAPGWGGALDVTCMRTFPLDPEGEPCP